MVDDLLYQSMQLLLYILLIHDFLLLIFFLLLDVLGLAGEVTFIPDHLIRTPVRLKVNLDLREGPL